MDKPKHPNVVKTLKVKRIRKPATPKKQQQVKAGEEIKTVVQMEVSGRGGTRLLPALPSQPFHEEASRSNAGDRPPYDGPAVVHAAQSADNTSRTGSAVQ